MAGLIEFDTVEGAFGYAEPLAHNFVEQSYGAQMSPEMLDQYEGMWAF